MIVGLILVGSVVGAMSALTVLMLGYSFWIAFCIYSAGGVLSVLLGAAAMACRSYSEDEATMDHAMSPPQHG
jgi:hypothetical protein